MIDHCIAAYNLSLKDKLYKIYVTDCLRLSVGGNDMPRYADLIDMLKAENHKETETAEQVIKRLSNGLDKIGKKKGGGR